MDDLSYQGGRLGGRDIPQHGQGQHAIFGILTFQLGGNVGQVYSGHDSQVGYKTSLYATAISTALAVMTGQWGSGWNAYLQN